MTVGMRGARACVIGLVTAASGCVTDLIAPVPGEPAVVRAEMLTGNALAALMPDGRLFLTPPALGGGQVPAVDAWLQSIKFARYVTNDGLLRGLAESDRGRWIDPHFLVLCGERYFAAAQVEFTEPDTLGRKDYELLKRTFGPQWLVPLCNDRLVPEVVVQVAVDANPIRIGDKGPDPLEEHAKLITAWVARGLPDYAMTALPVTPERAVTFAWDSLGVRISEVPQLVVRGSSVPGGEQFAFHVPAGFAVYCHRWRLELEREVQLRGRTTGTTAGTREVWVSTKDCEGIDARPVLTRPLALQPAPSWVQRGAVRVPVRFTSPVYFENAELVR